MNSNYSLNYKTKLHGMHSPTPINVLARNARHHASIVKCLQDPNDTMNIRSKIYPSLDSRSRRERRPGILCMRMREIIDNNFIIQIVKKRTKLQKGRIRMTM